MRWMIFRGVRRRRLFVVLESKEGKKLSIELTLLLVGSRCVSSRWEDAEGALKAPYFGLQGIFPFVRLMLPECFPGCLLRIVVVRFKRDGRWGDKLSADRIRGLIEANQKDGRGDSCDKSNWRDATPVGSQAV